MNNTDLQPGHSQVGESGALTFPELLRFVPLDGPRGTSLAYAHVGKRVLDLGLAVSALVFLLPLLLIVGLLIRLDSPGPALFRQRRLGRGGKPFWIWKFRSMHVDAEARLADLERLNEAPGGVLFKMKADPRVTRVGRFLRRTSLDELPQLFNVLDGSMSLVGPRPLPLRDCLLMRQIDESRYWRRLEAVPGLTGPWQVSGRSDTSLDRMLSLDLDYIDNWTFWRDVRLIARTFPVVVACRGAY